MWQRVSRQLSWLILYTTIFTAHPCRDNLTDSFSSCCPDWLHDCSISLGNQNIVSVSVETFHSTTFCKMIFPGTFILWKFSDFWSKCATRVKDFFLVTVHVQSCMMMELIEVLWTFYIPWSRYINSLVIINRWVYKYTTYCCMPLHNGKVHKWWPATKLSI